jgi:hypothetical protein
MHEKGINKFGESVGKLDMQGGDTHFFLKIKKIKGHFEKIFSSF